MMADKERQEDEIFALKNICKNKEFGFTRKENIECYFSISCILIHEKLLIEHDADIKGQKKFYINHLPPIRLYVQLPQNYPSRCAPNYGIAINWLPPWEVSLICQKLDELWQENEYDEILFIWMNFLKNELTLFLNIKDSMNISYLYNLYRNTSDKFLLEILRWTDSRIVYGGFDLNPMDSLLYYSQLEDLFEFESNVYECGICFATYLGSLCLKINLCKHIFCKNCVIQFLAIKIKERDVNVIKCPAFKCRANFNLNQIREILPQDLFKKYEKCLFEIRLFKRRNLVYCPRKICQTPVEIKDGESLASCPSCNYNFCAYCFKVYHGVMACDMKTEEKLKLIKKYDSANAATKKFLEKIYGRSQIMQIAEKQLTNNYLKEYTKPCPTCGILTTKITGCNLMNCLRCYTNFCWLCNEKIISDDGYDHFKFIKNGSCKGRLFEGIETDNDSDEGEDVYNDFQDIQDMQLFIHGIEKV